MEEGEGRPEAETLAEANSVAALLFVTNCSTADTPEGAHTFLRLHHRCRSSCRVAHISVRF